MPEPNAPTCRLIWTRDDQVGELVIDRDRMVLGRSRHCDLTIGDDSLSRRHAEFERTAAGFLVRDLGSLNGVILNGQRVPEAPIADGDRLRIGDLEFRVAIDSAALSVPVVFDEAPLPVDASTLTDAAGGGGPRTLEVAPGMSLSMAPGEVAVPATSPGEGTGLVRALREAAEALLAGRDLDDLLRRFLRIVARDLGAERGLVGLRNASTGEIDARATWAAGRWSREPITISRAIARHSIETRRALLVRDATTDARFADAQSIHALHIRSAMCAPLLRDGRVTGLLYVDTLGDAKPFTVESLQALTVLAALAAVAVEETRLKASVAHEQQLRSRLERYSSPAVVADILRAGSATDAGMRCEEREITVAFADFAGFTRFSDERAPAEVSRALNHAFEALCQAVFDEDGTLDKFTGDGMMVFFGAPAAQEDHAARAVRASLCMQATMAKLAAAGLPLALRIGINSGPAIVGDIGTPLRRDYTAIGATVNLAARLEHTVAAAGQIVIGPRTRELIGDAFPCTPIAPCALHGIAQPVRPWLVEATALPAG